MFERLAVLLERRSAIVLGLLLALSLASAAALPRLRFDFTPQALFAGNHDLLERSAAAKERFGHDDAVVLLVLEATGAEPVTALAPMRWLDAVSAAIADDGAIESVASLPHASVPFIVKPRPIELGLVPLIPYSDFEESDLGRVRAALASSPELAARFLSADRRLGVAYVQLPGGRSTLEAMREGVSAIERVLAATPPPRGFEVGLTGLPALRVAIVDSLEHEQARLLPLAGAAFVLVLAALFRSALWAILPLAAVGLGLLWTMGAMAASGHPVNIITNILPLLLFTLGTTNAVHFVARYAEEAAAPGAPPGLAAAARQAIAHTGLACLLCVLTTAAGFASLALSRTEVLRDLAWEAALGMGLLYLAIVLLLGATMRRFAPPAGRRDARGGLLGRVLAALAEGIIRSPRLPVAASVLLIGAAVLAARGVHVDSSMLEVYDDDHPSSLRIRQVEEHLGGFIALDLALSAPGAAGAAAPAPAAAPPIAASPLCEESVYLRVLALERFALADPDVLGVTSHVTLLEAIRTGPLGKAGGADPDPPTAATIREAADAVEPVAAALGLRRYLDRAGTSARLQVRVREVGTARTLALLERLEAEGRALFPPGGGVEVEATGDATVNARAMDGFVRDLFGSLLLAGVLVFALMTALLRSLRAGLCAALPNLTPLALTLGYMGIRGYPMNAGNAIVFTISLGVAVDDTIHFLARALEEMRRGRPVDAAIRAAMEGAGRAMVMVTALVVIGLSVLHLSDFVPNRRFAELMSVTMLGALLGDLILLPACVRLVFGRRALAVTGGSGYTAPALDTPTNADAPPVHRP